MFYGLYNQPIVVPESLYPTPLSHYEVGKIAAPPNVEEKEKTEKSEGNKEKIKQGPGVRN